MQDSIKREITIKASRQRIYETISDPKKVVLWFPETIEGDYTVGEQPIFGFGDHGRNQVCIVDASPFEYFAFRWVPGAAPFIGDVLGVANTLVEFRISEEPDGCCKLTLSETGFASLPADVADASYKQNCGGWDFMLGRLETCLASE